jgi:putative membrane protein
MKANIKSLYLLVLVIGISTMTSSQTVSKCDQKFVECTMKMGLMEVKQSELAQSKAVTTSIKTLAGQMVEYHSKANSDLKNLADKKNIRVASNLSDKQQRKVDKLSKCEGKKFDKKYAKCMKKMHKKGKCKMKKEARKGKDSELKAWAASQVPIYENHLTTLKNACKEIK